MRATILSLAALWSLMLWPVITVAQAEIEWGYIDLPDGVQLRYTAWLPEGDGPFPVLLQYEGYNAGSHPDRANDIFVPRMLDKGYAVVGVSLRGSGCSGGTWELFGEQQAKDGAFAVDWVAQRPWSNGKVGLFSYSYSGIMQLWVASMNPKHLVAAAPGMPVADTYRDIAYPGGIMNATFPSVWGASLNADWALAAAQALEEGDLTCLLNFSTGLVGNNLNSVALELLRNPLDNQWHFERSPINRVDSIRVPVFAVQSMQDEQTGARQSYWFNRMDPSRTWLISTNGHHTMYQHSLPLVGALESFFDYHLKGIDDGFSRAPKVQIWHETSVGDFVPRSVTYVNSLPVRVHQQTLLLTGEGTLALQAEEAGTATTYPYPTESPVVLDGSSLAIESPRINTWSVAPPLMFGRAAYTTPPLEETVTVYGPASADLWVSTTASDVDIQVTVSEVRPDGQEVYVQRGWLRASHRALDEARSTPLTPYHPHTAESVVDMPPAVPQLLRVEILPMSHTFRAGSSLRLYVEQPSYTGMWGFLNLKTPQLVSIHQGGDVTSKLVLGVLTDADVLEEYPDCAAIHSQPCRSNPSPQPGGSLRFDAGAGLTGTSTSSGGALTAIWALLLAVGLRLQWWRRLQHLG